MLNYLINDVFSWSVESFFLKLKNSSLKIKIESICIWYANEVSLKLNDFGNSWQLLERSTCSAEVGWSHFGEKMS